MQLRYVFISLGLFTACILLLYPAVSSGGPGRNARQVAIYEIQTIEMACLLYRNEYGRLPLGTESEIIHTLTGKNSKGKVFLDPEHIQALEEGELLDPWGTPYRIQIVPETHPAIQSAGKDGTWGTEDDLTTEDPSGT